MKKKYITRAKGGAQERKVALDEIVVPDIWVTGMKISKENPEAGRQVIETWHLAHDLLHALREGQAND